MMFLPPTLTARKRATKTVTGVLDVFFIDETELPQLQLLDKRIGLQHRFEPIEDNLFSDVLFHRGMELGDNGNPILVNTNYEHIPLVQR
jgi:hypothetical protein